MTYEEREEQIKEVIASAVNYDITEIKNILDKIYSLQSQRAVAFFCRKILQLSYSKTAKIMNISTKAVWMHITSRCSLKNVLQDNFTKEEKLLIKNS